MPEDTEQKDWLEAAVGLHERALLYEVLIKLHPKAAILSLIGTAIHEGWKQRARLFADELVLLNIEPPGREAARAGIPPGIRCDT